MTATEPWKMMSTENGSCEATDETTARRWRWEWPPGTYVSRDDGYIIYLVPGEPFILRREDGEEITVTPTEIDP